MRRTSQTIDPPTLRVIHRRTVGWSDPTIGLDSSHLVLLQSALKDAYVDRLNRALNRADRRTRARFIEDLRSILSRLLPLVDAGFDFHGLHLRPSTFELGEAEVSDASMVLARAVEYMRDRVRFRQCTGYLFRHVGTSGGLDLHAVLATPSGYRLDHKAAQNELCALLGGHDVIMPKCHFIYWARAGLRHYWPDLNPFQRREGLERFLLYLMRAFLKPRRDAQEDVRSFDRFHGNLFDVPPTRPPYPLTLSWRLWFLPGPRLTGRPLWTPPAPVPSEADLAYPTRPRIYPRSPRARQN